MVPWRPVRSGPEVAQKWPKLSESGPKVAQNPDTFPQIPSRLFIPENKTKPRKTLILQGFPGVLPREPSGTRTPDNLIKRHFINLKMLYLRAFSGAVWPTSGPCTDKKQKYQVVRRCQIVFFMYMFQLPLKQSCTAQDKISEKIIGGKNMNVLHLRRA